MTVQRLYRPRQSRNEAPDYYCGDPPELIGVPVFESTGFATRHGQPYPSRKNRQVSAEGTLWEWCASNADPGIWAEFGVAEGTSARYFLSRLPAATRLLLFDSFEGLPEAWQGMPKGRFACEPPVFDDPNVTIVKGLFADTLPVDEEFSFVHIDCDLYASCKTVLERINVRPGTIILFDELWGFPEWENHEYKALKEWGRKYEFAGRDKHMRAAVRITG